MLNWKINMMKPKLDKIILFIFIGMMPIHISMTSKDSTETNLRITGGYGQYAEITRGCTGDVHDKDIVPIREIGISIDHKTKIPFRLGINANYLRTKEEYTWQSIDVFTVNPFLNVEFKHFALGGGYLWADREIPVIDEKKIWTGYLRIGNIKLNYFDASFFHTTPVFSGSIFRLGFGFNKNPELKWWFGIGAIPQDNIGFIIRANIQIQKHYFLNTLVRLGVSEGISESTVGLGLTYRLIGND
jgi:hypothetical protein